ncbi:unnamed protein product [Trichobilharzia regenti]|nr:unnamed protein product [Trichobilharzia regenti]
MPNCMLKAFNSGIPGDAVIFIMAAYVVLNGVLIMCLTIGAKNGLWPVWRIVCVVIVLLLLITCILLVGTFQQLPKVTECSASVIVRIYSNRYLNNHPYIDKSILVNQMVRDLTDYVYQCE